MSTPNTSPDASGQGSQQPGWSSQQPTPPAQPQNPYGQPGYGQMPYGQPGYGQPGPASPYDQGYGYVTVEKLRSNSTWVLVLGILGIIQILGIIGAIAAWVWGNSLIKQARDAGLPEDVVQNAKIGKILGIIEVALAGVCLLLLLVLIAIGAFAFSQNPGAY